jgi:hypothetical protein
MSNYTQSTNFATKDALPSGDPLKIVKGTEINTEFNNIAVAVATKADLVSPTFTGNPVLPTGATGVTQTSTDDSTKLATTAFVQDVAAAVKEALFPVGSIYVNADVTTNPATLLGFGTWTAFGAGRVMVGLDAGDALFDTLEETGGSKDAIVVSHTHTGTTASAGDHAHRVGISMSSVGAETAQFSSYTGQTSDATRYLGGGGTTEGTGFNSGVNTQTVGAHDHTFTTASAGSSGTNANLQPYITVAMWKRTA